jgi:hypothetical protein
MGMKVIDLRPGNFLTIVLGVNTKIKTQITVHAVELHISVAGLHEDLCANFVISVNIIRNFIRMWILRTNILQYVNFIVISTILLSFAL